MKSIALIVNGKAHLPEVQAYKEYFSKKYEVHIVNSKDNLSSFDVLWYFMGTQGKRYREEQFLIHEYASLSTPPFSKIKNFIKRKITEKPDLRIFLNKKVKLEMGFNDNIPSTERDMGVSSLFINSYQKDVKPYKWDFIYVGAMDKSRRLHIAIDKILEYKPDAKIALVGNASNFLINRYKNYHVDFTGKIPYTEVPDVLKKAKIAINYIPDIYPYNIQTSTKLLEYLACKCVVLTNKYNWVEEYCNKRNLSILFFEDIDKTSEESHFSLNDLDENQKNIKLWSEVIYDSNIEEYLP